MASYEKLLQPLQVAGLRLKNRMLSAPTSMAELGPGEHYSDDNINYYKLKAAGGVALVSVGDVIVDLSTGRSHPMQVGLDDPTAVPYLVKMADAIHSGGAAAEIEIDHGGALCDPVFIDGKNAIGPSGYVDDWGDEVKEMTEEQIYEIADKFAEAAATAKACGFDMVMIHAGHGWLLHQFISEITNHRTDKWGGSLENRMRFPLLVVEKVRAAVGRAFPIDIRISGSERMPGGYDIQTGIEIAKALDGKVDLIHVSAGSQQDEYSCVLMHPGAFQQHGENVVFGAELKRADPRVGHKVVVIGGGLIGCEEGIELAKEGHEVTILEMQEELCPDCGRMHRLSVLHEIEVAETLHTATGFRCTGIDAEGVSAVDAEGKEVRFPADTVVMCAGMRPRSAEVERLSKYCTEFYVCGDATRARQIGQATRDGYDAVVNVGL